MNVINVSEFKEDSDEVKSRLSELKNMIDKQVFYNGDLYKIIEIASSPQLNGDVFSNYAKVILQPLKNIVIEGEDILNIKNVILEKIQYEDGHVEFKKMPNHNCSIDDNIKNVKDKVD